MKAGRADGIGSGRELPWDQRYGELYEDLKRPARAMIRRAFGSAFGETEIEDVYGNAWLSTLRALQARRDELSDAELRKYVLTAVANHASKELRRRGRRPTAPLEEAPEIADAHEPPDERVATKERSQLARDVLGTLPPRRRAVLMFRYGWGLKPEEVCGLIKGLSPRAYRKVKAASTVEGATQEPFALAAAAPLTQLVAPEVDPVNSREDASGAVNCQTDVTIETELENGSPDLDANGAEVTLNMPAGVQLVGGAQTQQVSDGMLDASTPASETHSWTVRATSSGTKQLAVTGEGGTMGETFTSSDQVTFDADCSPPAVSPTGTSVSAAGAICGSDQIVETRLENASITDAQSAEVALSLPAGVQLIGGLQTQEVSGGLLEGQSTSESHAWTVRVNESGTATVTGSGSDGTQSFAYPQSVALVCTSQNGGGNGPAPAMTTVSIDALRFKRGRILVDGHAASSAGDPPRGVVTVVAERKNNEKAKTPQLAGGEFDTKFKPCTAGRWRVSARFAGAPGFLPAESIVESVRVRRAKLRC